MHIKISNLNDLQDARYCSAMNFHLLSFNLQKGSPYFQTPDQIRQMAAWLTGPKFVIETDAESNDLLEEIYPTLPFDYVGVSANDWGKLAFVPPYPVILKTETTDVWRLESYIEDLPPHSLLEIKAVCLPKLTNHQEILDRALVVVNSIEEAIEYLSNVEVLPSGFSLYEGALDPEGGLDYAKLDMLAEKMLG